jgi:hypothetical protein
VPFPSGNGTGGSKADPLPNESGFSGTEAPVREFRAKKPLYKRKEPF